MGCTVLDALQSSKAQGHLSTHTQDASSLSVLYTSETKNLQTKKLLASLNRDTQDNQPSQCQSPAKLAEPTADSKPHEGLDSKSV